MGKKHDLNVGDVLHASWGYDQTNASFWQVTKTTDRCVYAQPISSELVEGAGTPSTRVRPVKDSFKGAPKRYFVAENGSIKVFSFARAYPADWTKTYYETGWGYGH